MTMAKEPDPSMRWSRVSRVPDPRSPGSGADHWLQAEQVVQVRTSYEFRASQPSPGRFAAEILHRGHLVYKLDGTLLNQAETKRYASSYPVCYGPGSTP